MTITSTATIASITAPVGDRGGAPLLDAAADPPTPRRKRPVRRPVRSSIASEWIKLRTLRSTAALLGLGVATGVVIVAGVTAASTETAPTIADGLGFPVVFSAVFAAVAGTVLFTSEVQHGTLDPTLTAQPSRRALTLAKAVIAAVFGATLALVGQIGGLAGGLATGTDLGGAERVATGTLWAGGFAALTAVLGLGVGMIVRHSAAAVSGLLVWWLVVENLVVVLAPAKVARLLPFIAGNAMVGVEMDSPDPNAAALLFTRPQNALLLTAYALLAIAIGKVALTRQDT